MIDPSRRHGHFDTRWHLGAGRPQVPVGIRTAEPDDSRWIQNWENEGGRLAMHQSAAAATGLDWAAFTSRYYPGRRRHDLVALKAYEAYRTRRSERASGVEVAA